MSAAADKNRAEADLCDLMGELAWYPYEYVLCAYPWGKPGPLEPFDGPDVWQAGLFKELGEEIRLRKFDGHTAVDAILCSVVSGRGVGKTAEVGMLCDFITSTRAFCKGTVTANTGPQLETKTWPEIVKWKRLGLTPHWFRITSGRGHLSMRHLVHDELWRLDGMQWQERSPDSFAGQHAATSTSFYVFDEASGIPANIINAAEDGMTTGEPMLFMFGNGRRNSGPFYESHNRRRDRYQIRLNVDGRKAAMTNKKKLELDIREFGIESDRVKIEILGEFPSQSSAQFISTDVVRAAMTRPRMSANLTDPVIIGCDVAWEGDDSSVIRFRQGVDAYSRPKEKYHGQDPMFIAHRLADLNKQLRPDAIFVDMTGIGAGVVARLRQLDEGGDFIPVMGVHFGGKSPDRSYHRQADYMWGRMRDWMVDGGCIEDSGDLESELTAREFSYDSNGAYVLEKKSELKARGEASPDDADGLCLTFAAPVAPRRIQKTEAASRGEVPKAIVGVDDMKWA